MDCSTSSVVGLSSPSTVTDGASNVTGTCGTTGYTGTVTLSCGTGTGILSASPSICACDTGAGYSLVGGVCISTCSYNVTGVSPTTGTVTGSSGFLTCTSNATNHYVSSYAYTCSGGAAITGTCACATGYSGAGCSTCDSANGYTSGGGGTSVLGCSVPAGSGPTLTVVAQGTTSTACDSSGYAGTLSYTCSTVGVPIAIGTPCIQTCTITPPTVTADTSVSGSTIYKFVYLDNYIQMGK
jgi:hypothetical protein